METIDFQKTLNLPKTDFSMRAGLMQKEPQYVAQWEVMNLYEKIKDQTKGKPPFILHDGPPYANGNIHIGHSLNKIIKDMIVKDKAMLGFDSHYVPGWDCHGLPIEHQLLKDLKKRKGDVDCVDFRKKAHEYALKYVDIQKEQFRRLGILGDWDRPYLTLNKNYEYWILKSLEKLVVDGYIYRGLKPVNWCYQCETALAEAEVEYQDQSSTSVYVKFEVLNADKILSDRPKKVSLLIWTTTPWTLVANVAVSVNAELEYVCLDLGDEVIIVESLLASGLLEKANIQETKELLRVKGRDLVSLKYWHPFNMIKEGCRVVTADYVTNEDGTGLVHTAPGHGVDDFLTGKKYDLPVLMPVDDRGVYTEGPFGGQHISKSVDFILRALSSQGVLYHCDNFSHSYPHCWRCKKPIIFRATHQWFMRIDHNDLRDKCKHIVKDEVNFVPSSGRERILGMISDRPDWCLSRQRYWGVPIPALISKKDGGVRLYPEVIARFADICEKEGTDSWFERDVEDFIPKGFSCPETGCTEFEKTFDILDVWFDSGISHQAVVKSMMGRDLPAQLYLEGSDQHRGWFQSSLLPSVAMEGAAPFEEVLTHGFVVDGQGRKMSKSLGNVIAPNDIINNGGADILRLWVATRSYNEDMRISKEVLDRTVDAYRKIRNTFKYILGNISDFNPDTDSVVYENLLDIDKWALNRLVDVVVSAKSCWKNYEFAKAYRSIYVFCNEDLSNNYLDILKDRLYILLASSNSRRSAQTVLFHILNYLVRLLAPVLVFTMEEVFSMMPKTKDMKGMESVHLLKYLDIPQVWKNEKIADDFALILRLRPFVLKMLENRRSEKVIGGSLEARLVFTTDSDMDYKYLTHFGRLLADFFIVSQAEVTKVDSLDKSLGGEFQNIGVDVLKAEGRKCSRCWKYAVDVGEHKEFPTLSSRCVKIVKELQNGTKKENG